MSAESVGFFWLFLISIHPQRYTAPRWPFLRVGGLNKTPWQSCLLDAAEIMEDTVLFVFPVLPGLPIFILFQNLEFFHSHWAFETGNLSSVGLWSKQSPWRTSKIAGHFLVPRSNTEVPVNLHGYGANLQRRAGQYWSKQKSCEKKWFGWRCDSGTHCRANLC